MPTTYTPLFSTVVSSPTGTIVFSSIPATYTDLVLVGNVLSTSTSASVNVQFNGDGGNNYSYVVLDGNGSAVQANRQGPTSAIQFAAWSSNLGSSTNPSPMIMHINNYSNTSMHKQVLIKSTAYGASTACIDLFAGFWNNTAAINQITVACGNFAVGSTVSLYGIASAAVVSGAKATGGDVVATDGTYWYHAFRTSGTFTPTQALSADVLVIAGGGGSGFRFAAGGGGAGGLVYLSAQSLTAQNYVVTVGAGGAKGTDTTDTDGFNGGNSQFGSTTAAIGGGGGASYSFSSNNGADGGSGGGGSGASAGNGGLGTAGQGNNGGARQGPNYAGGGGGAGEAGNTDGRGDGGDGLSTYSAFGLATGTGQNVSGTVWFAGGGAGFDNDLTSLGGLGGGGNEGQNGTANTGGGGGGTYSEGGNGGSGLVIVRYAV